MRLGTQLIGSLLTVLLVASGMTAQHACVVPASTAESDEHQHHSSSVPSQDAPEGERSCEMYVPCGVSVVVANEPLEVHLNTIATSRVEPRLSYYSPALPHETPPPRV